MTQFLTFGDGANKVAIVHPGNQIIGDPGTAMKLMNLPIGDIIANMGAGADSVVAGTSRMGETISFNMGLDNDIDVGYAFAAPGFGLPVIHGPHDGLYYWAVGGKPPAVDLGNGKTHEVVKNTYYPDDTHKVSLKGITELHGPGAKASYIDLPEFNTKVQTVALAGHATVYSYTLSGTIRMGDGRLRSKVEDVRMTNDGHDDLFDPLHGQSVRVRFNADADMGYQNPDSDHFIFTQTSDKGERMGAVQALVDLGYDKGGFDGNGWVADVDLGFGL